MVVTMGFQFNPHTSARFFGKLARVITFLNKEFSSHYSTHTDLGTFLACVSLAMIRPCADKWHNEVFGARKERVLRALEREIDRSGGIPIAKVYELLDYIAEHINFATFQRIYREVANRVLTKQLLSS